VPQFAGLSLNKIGDLGAHILKMEELPPTLPLDQEAIELAVAIQTRRRSVQQQVDHARETAAAGTH
jgi:hypothetical protein